MKTLKELNYWSKKVWGVNFPILIGLFALAEYAISRLPVPA